MTDTISSFDRAIYNFLISFRNYRLDAFFKTITMFANTITVIIITILLLIALKRKEQFMLLTVVISTVGVNQILKHIIRRARPEHLRLIKETGFSYPSGHAMISIALYGFMIYYIYQNVRNKYLKIIMISFLSVLIVAIGCSRIYVGVHYPSDVLGGYLLSFTILMAVINFYNNHFRGDLYGKNGSK